jgi:invasion protein IalB
MKMHIAFICALVTGVFSASATEADPSQQYGYWHLICDKGQLKSESCLASRFTIRRGMISGRLRWLAVHLHLLPDGQPELRLIFTRPDGFVYDEDSVDGVVVGFRDGSYGTLDFSRESCGYAFCMVPWKPSRVELVQLATNPYVKVEIPTHKGGGLRFAVPLRGFVESFFVLDDVREDERTATK